MLNYSFNEYKPKYVKTYSIYLIILSIGTYKLGYRQSKMYIEQLL